MRYKEICPSVVVIISKSCPARPAGVLVQAGLSGYIGECSITIVPIQYDAVETCNKQIGPSVIVVIANGGSHRPTRVSDACFVSDVGKSSVVIIMKECAAGLLARQLHRNVWRVGEVDVRPSIAIEVNERDTATH